ncbi:ribonucleoside-diphosphate reductase subunit alpha [Silvanigrella aquatica]|uniref:Ribonucleoside-diphosphate reductase n=1 Tax=Silvanigrella aquatica TaxID=1915309 RepID=A0A1L4D0K9_9BACT|nr:ribonucleoside-diphosphate reductase subunit alpha [Silvanigrella aquatica]APJ03736.1 ribonucleoside-diphosphate reductase subunit alpha [Silvanigrella aquatica]
MAMSSYRPYHPKANLSELNFSNVDFNSSIPNIILDVRPLIEQGREYSYIAASLLSEQLRLEVLNTIGMSAQPSSAPEQEKHYPTLSEYVAFGTSQGQLSSRLRELDLEYLNSCIRHERNYLFDYLGSHTLYDRYLLHKKGMRYESFQHFWMRVAMGVALAEGNAVEATKHAAEFYEVVSQMLYVPSTPTLFNSGTNHSQMSSCFLTTTQDDLLDIYRQYSDNAMLSKYAGGLGNDWTNIRGSGSWIKGTNGRSQGVIPFIKVQDSSTIAVNQGGKRKGAVCAYLETWHLDIEDFLELRKNTGDERRRTHDMNTANWIPDLFLERVESNSEWTLFCPSEAKDLHESYGEEFKRLYEIYEQKAAQGEIQNYKKVSAVQLWRKILTMIFETGHPWVTFKDPCNLRSAQRHAGVVHSSNLCTEITLNTNSEETAVCNLGSINLKAVFQSENPAKTLAHAVSVGMRMLDNVITENFYPIKSAETANHRHRPVGLGFMGFQDVLYMKKIPYSKPEAMWLSEKIAEYISFHAIKTSALLAAERGSYSSYQGSVWSKGKVPKDTITELGSHVRIPEAPTTYVTLSNEQKPCEDLLFADGFKHKLDWDEVRHLVGKGMRNSLCLAVAPTATISNISNCTQSIEPTYKNLYVKSNMGGDYTIINEYLIDDLKALGLWSADLSRELKRYDGALDDLDVPEHIKELYKTAFDMEPEQLIRCASLRQIYIDQAQSLNLYMSAPSGKKIDEMYRYAWHSGLKTTYYLRTRAATGVEKSSLSSVKRKETILPPEVKACSIDNPECESCQ